jgi:hypothetical protein
LKYFYILFVKNYKMSVSDAELDAATPEQVMLFGKIFAKIVKKSYDAFLPKLYEGIKASFKRNQQILSNHDDTIRESVNMFDKSPNNNSHPNINESNTTYAPRVHNQLYKHPNDYSRQYPFSFDEQIIKDGKMLIKTGDTESATGIYYKFLHPGSATAVNKTTGVGTLKDGTFEVGICPKIDSTGKLFYEINHRNFRAAVEQQETFLKGLEAEIKCDVNGTINGDVKVNAWRRGIQNMKQSVMLGAGLNAVFNIELLFNGDIGSYAVEVGKGASYAAVQCGAQEVLTNTVPQAMAEYAGPIAGVLVGTFTEVYGVCYHNDWSRFGKNMTLHTAAVGGGFAGAKCGALAGAWFGPFGMAIGGVTGGITGAVSARWITGKIPFIGGETAKEELKRMTQFTKEYRERLKEQGTPVPDNISDQELIKQIGQKTSILKGTYSWDEIGRGKILPSTLLKPGMYRETMRLAFTWAKFRSPTMNITEGLKLMLDEDLK